MSLSAQGSMAALTLTGPNAKRKKEQGPALRRRPRVTRGPPGSRRGPVGSPVPEPEINIKRTKTQMASPPKSSTVAQQ